MQFSNYFNSVKHKYKQKISSRKGGKKSSSGLQKDLRSLEDLLQYDTLPSTLGIEYFADLWGNTNTKGTTVLDTVLPKGLLYHVDKMDKI